MDYKQTDPQFMERFEQFAFEEVVQKDSFKLDVKTRYLAILASLIGCQGKAAYRLMLEKALNEGMDPVMIKEMVYQAQDYMGLGRMWDFLRITNEVYLEKEIPLSSYGQATTTMEDRLEKNEQIMLFLNRRGYANFVSCRQCGYVVTCPHCDVSMTYHKNGSLRCHYCGFERQTPKICPQCSSKYIASFGTGTQKVEEAVKREFPNSRVLRMDMDTTRGKEGFDKILDSFSKGEANILIGTQMIVKGHDFPKVTLVGIIAADLSLHSSDYRAGERTFQLLTQAAGRAGRDKLAGDVVIQTYSPHHYSIVTASMQNYEAFYEQEMAYRRIMKYPPIYQMLTIFIASKEQKKAVEASLALLEAMKQWDEEGELLLIGPSEASFSKLQDVYRRVFYIKHLDYEMLVKSKNFLEGYIEYSAIFKEVQVQFDFNAMTVY